MPLAPVFEHCFSQLIGRPCWQVKHGYGSFITLEFGNPHLEIREPRSSRPVTQEASRDVHHPLDGRLVKIRGDWHLWVYCCNWSILEDDEPIGTSNDDAATTDSALRRLDGQALTGFSADPPAEFRFTFDLGCTLATSPYDADSEQWMLYETDGNVLCLRADGRYSYSPATTKQELEKWQPVWTR